MQEFTAGGTPHVVVGLTGRQYRDPRSATDILTVNVSRTPARDIDAEGFQNGYAAPRRSTRLVQIFGLAAAADGDALC
ncbi:MULTISPECIES: hypothetical protein [Mycolicibacterium]|uniref:hypothetical protein n=1 Tax=Mycolicibacterium TaxID=1866885 RepID=UPI0006852C39|nr:MULTISPECIES: hypothetical protein [Mycolicibacterium]MCC9185470.1 hypothetical protein [Mycolicibacterium mageritense]MCV7210771.1 hypothetical protein [Mycolicibacterium canariasense]